MRLDKYLNYSVTELATDPAFIAWVKHPDSKKDKFWKKFVNRYPGHSGQVEKAKSIVMQMHIERNEMGEEHAKVVWKNIAEKIIVTPVLQLKSAKIIRRRFWIPAAAVLLLALMGTWFLLDQNNKEENVLAAQPKAHDILPGTNKAILTLADGTKIVLDSANNGAITKQGNVTIIKLNDGLLSYDPSSIPSTIIKYNTITTPRGGQYQLVLADGSKVWLNAASSLRFPNIFPGEDRRVELTGEGYFEIAHNTEKPFYVEVGDMEVKVLGTHFNVNAYEDEPNIRTTLLEGSVQVMFGPNSKTITPGEQAQIKTGGEGTIGISQADVNAAVAWKNGYFHFNDANLKEVMRQLSRWYDIDVQYGENMEPRRFGGEIARSSTLNEVLKILEESKVHFMIEGRNLLVAP